MAVTENGHVNEDRRRLLRNVAGAPLTAGVVDLLGADAVPTPQSVESTAGGGWFWDDEGDVFPQSVASGDPTASGAILWTRIDPGQYASGTPLELVVATDDEFERDRRTFAVGTDGIDDHDYTVRVDLDGRLASGRRYYYRFVYDGVASETGQFRTLPAVGASPDRVRFGVVNCQDYRNGYYGAFGHLAREDLDFVLHLGDFIYEYGGFTDDADFYEYFDRYLDLPSGRDVAVDLTDFRYLYRTYRGDRLLQAALENHALIPTWDDHEIVDNRYWDYEADQPRPGDGAHPYEGDPEAIRRLFAAGIRAWWEYMPARVGYDPGAQSLQDRLRLYRSFEFGDLLDLVVTDERLYRTSPTDGDKIGFSFDTDVPATVTEDDIDETMLGEAQREWFLDRVTGSEATWTTWANEVLLTDFRLGTEYASVFNADAWDGFATERRYLLEQFQSAGIENLVVCSGDLHSSLAGYVVPTEEAATDPDRRLGIELMTPAVTSANLRERLDILNAGAVERRISRTVTDSNPSVEAFDSGHWGYAVVELTPEACEFTVYSVDKSVDSAAAPREELFSYRVPAGEPELQRL